MEANFDTLTRLLFTHKINWYYKHLFHMHKVFLLIVSVLTMSQKDYTFKSMFMHKKGLHTWIAS